MWKSVICSCLVVSCATPAAAQRSWGLDEAIPPEPAIPSVAFERLERALTERKLQPRPSAALWDQMERAMESRISGLPPDERESFALQVFGVQPQKDRNLAASLLINSSPLVPFTTPVLAQVTSLVQACTLSESAVLFFEDRGKLGDLGSEPLGALFRCRLERRSRAVLSAESLRLLRQSLGAEAIDEALSALEKPDGSQSPTRILEYLEIDGYGSARFGIEYITRLSALSGSSGCELGLFPLFRFVGEPRVTEFVEAGRSAGLSEECLAELLDARAEPVVDFDDGLDDVTP